MDIPDLVEHFFGVYLLFCLNPKYKGRTYIGYTVNPKRRLKQHNAGHKFGGAVRTSNRGPWTMVLVVHGFPNSTAALRFEWAWQHPELSRRLRHVPKKRTSQKVIEYRLMVLSEMLRVGPWCRLPLTLRWLDLTLAEDYKSLVSPPMHMPISFCNVTSKSIKKNKKKKTDKKSTDDKVGDESVSEETFDPCFHCGMIVKSRDRITCIKPGCELIGHVICLAKIFRTDQYLLPIEGDCPKCKSNVLWGDLIRKKIGCNLHLQIDNKDEQVDCDSSDNFSDNYD